MKLAKANVVGGMIVIATVVVALGLLAGNVTSASPAGSALTGLLTPSGSVTNTSQSFNFSTNHPVWNSGNLCTPVVSGAVETCNYTGSGGHGYGYWGHGGNGGGGGGCGCQAQPLTYNFSGANLSFVVNLANVDNQAVYLNFVGHNDSILINVTGCRGGTLNVSVLMQTTLTLDVAASHVSASIYLYSDADHYVGNISGNCVNVWTYFVSAKPKYNECPAANNTKTDSYLLNVTGNGDAQGLVFVNGVGYSTPLNTVWTGTWNSVSFENTTTFGCSWSNAPASQCHHHGWAPAGDGTGIGKRE